MSRPNNAVFENTIKKRMMLPLLNGTSGAGLVELALVLPLILFLIFSALETVRIVRTRQAALGVVREIAVSSFRDCSQYPGSVNTGTPIEICVSPILEQSMLHSSVPNGEVVLTRWRWDSVSGCVRDYTLASPTTAAARTRITDSYFSSAPGSSAGPLTPLGESCRDQGKLFFAEILYPNQPILQLSLPIYRLFSTAGESYAVAFV